MGRRTRARARAHPAPLPRPAFRPASISFGRQYTLLAPASPVCAPAWGRVASAEPRPAVPLAAPAGALRGYPAGAPAGLARA